MLALEVGTEQGLELFDLRGLNLVEIALHTGEKDAGLLLYWHGHVLLLLKQFGKLLASVQQLLGNSIEV